MMLAVQIKADWLLFGIAAIMVLTSRTWNSVVLFGITLVILVFFKDMVGEYWPFVLFGLIILALVLGGKQKEEQQDPYGGGGGMEGLFGGAGGMGQ